MVNNVGQTFGLIQASNGLPTPDPQWAGISYANLVVNPVDGSDLLISSGTGNVFETTNEGGTWFDITQPSTSTNPTPLGLGQSTSYALAFGALTPVALRGSAISANLSM